MVNAYGHGVFHPVDRIKPVTTYDYVSNNSNQFSHKAVGLAFKTKNKIQVVKARDIYALSWTSQETLPITRCHMSA